MASPCQRSLPGKLTARAQGGQATVARSFHWARPEVDLGLGVRTGKGMALYIVIRCEMKLVTQELRDKANHTGGARCVMGIVNV